MSYTKKGPGRTHSISQKYGRRKDKRHPLFGKPGSKLALRAKNRALTVNHGK